MRRLIGTCAVIFASLVGLGETDVYLLIGQSNMAGRGSLAETNAVPNDGVFMLTSFGYLAPAVEPLHFDKRTAGAGLGLPFASEMRRGNPGREILLVPCAFGGTKLSEWQRGTYKYDFALLRTRHALKLLAGQGRLRGILWHQGEWDSIEKEDAETYCERFCRMMNDLRQDLEHEDLPIVFGELGRFLADANKRDGNPYAYFEMVNESLRRASHQLKNCALVSSVGLTSNPDLLHFDTPSLRILGLRYAAAMKKLIANSQCQDANRETVVAGSDDPGYKSMGAFIDGTDEKSGIGLRIESNRETLVYDFGEDVVFNVTVTNGVGEKASHGRLKVTVSDYTFKPAQTREVDLSCENPFVLRGTMTEPGFLRFEIEGEGATKTVRGAAFAPERIRAAGTCPEDFDAFWSEAKAKLAREVPLDPRLVHIPERSTDKFDFWRVSFATFGGQRVWGFLTVPKDRSKAPFPVRFSISSAGTGRWTWDFERALHQDEVINMSFTVHRFEPPTNQADADRLHKRLIEELKAECGVGSYPVAGLGKSREDAYFYRPILGIDRAVDWLWSRPDVDRRSFTYFGGSQGGGLGVILLGLNHKFTAALLHVPAMMDLLGGTVDRICGFPDLAECYERRADRDAAFANAAYFNGAFFAARVTCPVRISMGFIDNVCPPTGVYAGYNALRVKDRQILHGLYRAHGWWPEAEVWEEWLRCDNGNRENQKRRTE